MEKNTTKKTKKIKKPKAVEQKVKKKAKKITSKETTIKEKKKEARYIEAVGRRKTAVARVRLWTRGKKELLINDKPCQDYFPTFELQQIATGALNKMKSLGRFRVLVKVKGGGVHSQAEAIRHGIARALVMFNADYKKRLRKAGYLTRDPRMRERKKFGLKRARRAPQWQKR